MAMDLAQTAQASINRYKIKSLEYNDDDLVKDEFNEIKSALRRLTYSNEEIKYSYIMVVYENEVLAAVDSELIYSQNYKHPGTLLGSPEDFGLDLDKANKPYILYESPLGKDYVAAIAPVAADHSGEIIGLYANLYPQNTWKNFAIIETIHVTLIAAVIFILLNAFYFVGSLNYYLYNEKRQLIEANQQISKAKIQETKNLRQIRKSEKKLSKIFQMVPTMMILTSSKGEIKEVNEAFLKKISFEKENVIGKSVFDLNIFLDKRQLSKIRKDFERSSTISYDETRIKSRRGKEFDVYMSLDFINYDDQKDFIFSFVDITQRKKAEEKIKDLIKKYKAIIAVSNTGGWEYNVTKNIFSPTEEYFSMLGFTSKKQQNNFDLKKDWYELIHPEDRDKAYNNFMGYIKKNMSTMYENVFRLRCKNGKWLWILSRGRRIHSDDGKLSNIIIGTHIDITDLKRKEEQIEYLNYHDQLTGLKNRRSYEKAIKDYIKKDNLPLAVVMADVNGLKLTNDAFGHLCGDNLLIRVSDVLKSQLRPEDFVARIGGDEFIILMPKSNSLDAEKLVDKINKALAQAQSDNMVVSVSFGWATKKDENEDYINVYKRAEYRMYRKKLSERKSKRSESIKIIFRTLQEKSEQERQHSERVSRYCLKIGREMGLSYKEILELETAGLMHDIGKIGIEENILNKKDKLSDEEWRIMKRHSEIGYRILSSANEFNNISNYVLYHHERWDGGGYPRNLKGEEIPLISRIIAVADSFDAMTSQRCYKKSLTKQQAIEEIVKNAGTQFDPHIAKVFVNNVLKKAWEE